MDVGKQQSIHFIVLLSGLTANIAMFKTGLTAVRSSEQLILNKERNVYVNGAIAQYLLNHQINGVRFLYRNYEKVIPTSISYYIYINIVCVCQHKQSIQLFSFHF